MAWNLHLCAVRKLLRMELLPMLVLPLKMLSDGLLCILSSIDCGCAILMVMAATCCCVGPVVEVSKFKWSRESRVVGPEH